MSEEDLGLLAERFFEAWTERNPELLVELCDPEIEFLLPRNLLEGGSYKGHDGVRQAMADGYETWQSFGGEIKSVREIGDRAVLRLHSVQLARHEGPQVEYDLTYVLKLRQGRILHARPFLDYEDALKAVGLEG